MTSTTESISREESLLGGETLPGEEISLLFGSAKRGERRITGVVMPLGVGLVLIFGLAIFCDLFC